MLNQGVKVYFQSQTGIESIEGSERTRRQHLDLIQSYRPNGGTSSTRLPSLNTPQINSSFGIHPVKPSRPIFGIILTMTF